ncbi:hypothetical protein PRIPAC_74386 [Pristionchus pacificus]|uniref:Uncharacterized protein n=1 Tax=Pristionchus pacificus TaxID=54126 RepID=A0A2A6C6Q5_PRIPA|nr:hypothetical protein PRIPAC_74386 [Pristionchus pacificus]|eukprot:PDM73854.1 hypothetical protein PRIPAC_41210 [Pristionchus pacificus]
MCSSRAVLRSLLLIALALAAGTVADTQIDSEYSANAVSSSSGGLPTSAPSVDAPPQSMTSLSMKGSAQCADLFAAVCKQGAKDEHEDWLTSIVDANRDKDDKIKKDFSLATLALSIRDGKHPEEQTEMRLAGGEKSKGDIEEIIKKECSDFACLEKYYKPLLTFFTVYARGYEGRDDKGTRALAALEYMDRFKKLSMFYNILLERSYVHKYRLITIAKITSKIKHHELQKTAAGTPQVDLLGLSYIDILKEEWSNMKVPEDDNVEEAFYRKAYDEGLQLWNKFGSLTGTILAHVSALHSVNKQYPGDILDLVSADTEFDNKRFLRPIQKADRLVLPESFLVESVYRTKDNNMGLLAFRLAKIMLRRAFAESGTDLVKHMQDDVKNCTTNQFRATYLKMYNKIHNTRGEGDDIYFMEVNGAARFFKPFSDAFDCKDGDNLHYVESSCLPLGSSNIHRRASAEL